MSKVLVKVYVPMLEKQYDVWIPSHKRIYNVIYLLTKAVNEFNDGCYQPKTMPELYDKLTAKPYDINLSVKETTIRNGSEVILI